MKKVKLRTFNDDRGSLTENTLEEIMLQSHHFFVSKSLPNVIRGNHYHERKSEWFYVIQGVCKVCVVDIKTKKKEEIEVNGNDNIILHMQPLKAHAFQNVGTTELILLALVNEVLDKEKPDTIPYKVL